MNLDTHKVFRRKTAKPYKSYHCIENGYTFGLLLTIKLKQMKLTTQPLKNDWSYLHSFGIVTLGDADFICLTETKYWKGKSWGYNYYLCEKLDKQTETKEQRVEIINRLNKPYGLSYFLSDDKLFMDAKNSQQFIIHLSQSYQLLNQYIKK